LKFWKKNLQCHPSDFTFEFVASAFKNLQVQSDKRLIRFAISDSIVLVLDNSALDISGHELAVAANLA